LQALAGNDVTLFPLWATDDDWREVYASSPQSIEVILGVGAAGLEAFLSERTDVYDFLMVSRPPNMAFVNTLWTRKPELFRGMRLVYDAEAVFAMREIGHAAIQGRPLNHETAQRMLREELALTERAEVVLSVSSNETRLFEAAGAHKVCLLSHSMETRTDTPGWRERQNLLFVGALHPDTPNEDGLLWFCTQVLPQLEIRHGLTLVLDVVGDCFSEKVAALASQRIHLCGRVAELTEYYDTHRIFVAPTRYAAGVPAKVIEAACNGIPVVATQLLANQLGWRSGQEMLASDEADAFSDALAALYGDENLWKDLQTRMQERTQQDFAPEPFHRTLHSIFTSPLPQKEPDS
jgi:glycosyltransferase involved in cell wall biosynthesis